MPNTSTTDEPSVVTFAHAMSTPSRSNTAVSLASMPGAVGGADLHHEFARLRRPRDHRIFGGAARVVDRHRVRHLAGAGGAVLRRVAVAPVQRRQHVQFALEGKDELLAQQLGGRW